MRKGAVEQMVEAVDQVAEKLTVGSVVALDHAPAAGVTVKSQDDTRPEGLLFVPNTAEEGEEAEEPVAAVKRSSFELSERELKEMNEEAEETPKEDALEDDLWAVFKRRIENITREQADQILAELVENEGRMKIEVKRRSQDPLIGYVRVPTREEDQRANMRYAQILHSLRKGRKDDGNELKLPTTAEFITDLYDSLPSHQRQEIDAIQGDATIHPAEKNRKILEIFRESPYLTLVQYSADVFATAAYNDLLTITTLETRVVNGTTTWKSLFGSVEAFRTLDDDVCEEVITRVFLTHQKLRDARFLPSSSDAPVTGDIASASESVSA